jgi:hypothetical protein
LAAIEASGNTPTRTPPKARIDWRVANSPRRWSGTRNATFSSRYGLLSVKRTARSAVTRIPDMSTSQYPAAMSCSIASNSTGTNSSARPDSRAS